MSGYLYRNIARWLRSPAPRECPTGQVTATCRDQSMYSTQGVGAATKTAQTRANGHGKGSSSDRAKSSGKKGAPVAVATEDRAAAPEPLFSAAHEREARRARSWLKDRLDKSKKLPVGEIMMESCDITPVLAEVMMEYNRGNRPLKPRRFQYAETMKAGDWKFHSQPISFSRDELLNNGQNRLSAVVLSGCTVRMMVAFGESRDVFPVIDTGAPRGGSDSLHVAGYKNTTILAASARTLHTATSRSPRTNLSISNDHVIQIVRDHPELESSTTHGGKVGQKIRGATAAGPTVAHYLIYRRSQHARRLDNFFSQLKSGNISKKRDPILVLRDALMERRIATHKGDRAVQVSASIILAWNLWVRGRTATLPGITWEPGQPFPMPE